MARTGGKYQFETAEQLRSAAMAYFDYCDKNPIRGSRTVRKEDGETVTIDEQKPRPYTFEGLCESIDIWDWSLFRKNNIDRKGFAPVFGWIRNKIRRNQIEGGLVGVYKENITARLNGISDNMQVTERPPVQYLKDEE